MGNKGTSSGLDFSTIIASSVHDMKNSIQLLLGTLDEVIDELPVDEKSHTRVLRAEAEGRRINDQLIQLLTLYKMSNTQHCLQIDEHCVDEFLEEINRENHPLLSLRGIELTVRCEEGLVWFFDRELLKGVVNNLITNAQQHTRNRIALSAVVHEKKLRLSVSDNGPGFPHSMLKHGDAADEVLPGDVNTRSGGTGLGLYFSTTIAQLHKNRNVCGYLENSNEGVDGGACCTIVLP